jgi:hypothetical protein
MAAKPKSEWPLPAGWIDRTQEDPLRVRIVERMYCDLYIAERSSAANRGGRIDVYLRRAGVPESVIASGKGYWCAAWLGAVWDDAGAAVPPQYASCDAWIPWAKKRGQWYATPCIGAAALYGIPGDASHIGGVIRIPKPDYPYLMDIEGNTSINGYSRNGVLVDGKEVSTSKLLGYVHPVAA